MKRQPKMCPICRVLLEDGTCPRCGYRVSKYGVRLDEDGVIARTFRGKVYPSKLECSYARELELRLRAHDVVLVREQVSLPLYGRSGQKVATYIADFEITYPDGRVEYVDTKGISTDVFQIKQRWLEADYPEITLRIVRRK